MTLYSYYRSSTAYRARIALNFKQIEYNQIPVHLLEDGGQQNKAEYRKINPIGGVPTLIHQGKTISQTVALIEYLEELTHTPRLLPDDLYLRAKIRQACEIINADIHPLTNLKVTQFLSHEFGLTPEQVSKWQKNWLSKGLEALENTIIDFSGIHAFGDTITMADVFIIPQLFSARRFGIDTSTYTVLHNVDLAAGSMDAFIKAHPHNQPDTPAEFKGKI